MIIPGILITWLTFPGVIVHEFAHALFCRLCKVAIFEVKYFQFGAGPSGYVVHGPTSGINQAVLIGVEPFIVNTLIGGIIGAPAALPVIILGSRSIPDLLLFWLGISIAMHSFPSKGDAESILSQAQDAAGGEPPPGVKFVCGLIKFLSFASMFWIDLIWALAVVGGVPYLIVQIFARL